MKLSRDWKIFIGFITILQMFAGLALLIFFIMSVFPELTSGEPEMERELVFSFGKLIISVIVLTALSVAISIFYVIHAGTNPSISNTMKIVWIGLILIFAGVVEIVYFFMEIAPERSMTSRIERSDIQPNRY